MNFIPNFKKHKNANSSWEKSNKKPYPGNLGGAPLMPCCNLSYLGTDMHFMNFPRIYYYCLSLRC